MISLRAVCQFVQLLSLLLRDYLGMVRSRSHVGMSAHQVNRRFVEAYPEAVCYARDHEVRELLIWVSV